MPNGLHGSIVQAACETTQNLDVADSAVAPHHDFEDDIAAESALPCILRIVRAHLSQETRWLDAAAGSVGTAAGCRAGSGATSDSLRTGAWPEALLDTTARAPRLPQTNSPNAATVANREPVPEWCRVVNKSPADPVSGGAATIGSS